MKPISDIEKRYVKTTQKKSRLKFGGSEVYSDAYVEALECKITKLEEMLHAHDAATQKRLIEILRELER